MNTGLNGQNSFKEALYVLTFPTGQTHDITGHMLPDEAALGEWESYKNGNVWTLKTSQSADEVRYVVSHLIARERLVQGDYSLKRYDLPLGDDVPDELH